MGYVEEGMRLERFGCKVSRDLKGGGTRAKGIRCRRPKGLQG